MLYRFSLGVFLIVKFPLRHQKNRKNADGVWVLFGGTSLLSSSPSVKYRVRKQESEKKLERTKLNLLRINDILSEIEANIEPLKQSSEKAKKYLNLREELKNIEIGLFIYNIEKYKQSLEEIVKDEEIYKSQCNEEEGRLERVKALKEELKSQIDEITVKIEEM